MKEACVTTGVEQGKKIVWEQVSAGEVDRKSEESVAARTQEMEDSLVTFMEMDFTCHLLLGALDVAGIRDLCQESQNEAPSPDDHNTSVGK